MLHMYVLNCIQIHTIISVIFLMMDRVPCRQLRGKVVLELPIYFVRTGAEKLCTQEPWAVLSEGHEIQELRTYVCLWGRHTSDMPWQSMPRKYHHKYVDGVRYAENPCACYISSIILITSWVFQTSFSVAGISRGRGCNTITNIVLQILAGEDYKPTRPFTTCCQTTNYVHCVLVLNLVWWHNNWGLSLFASAAACTGPTQVSSKSLKAWVQLSTIWCWKHKFVQFHTNIPHLNPGHMSCPKRLHSERKRPPVHWLICCPCPRTQGPPWSGHTTAFQIYECGPVRPLQAMGQTKQKVARWIRPACWKMIFEEQTFCMWDHASFRVGPYFFRGPIPHDERCGPTCWGPAKIAFEQMYRSASVV